ncbi:phosphate transport system protein [Pseudoxanthobacter soli DSM 19599]|uniref:Phosphate-specific transport system accessory protein PhoU n=1 Tax=Pseudoxanthobacter soli DSM 19599 TaxID=1123029 RepID=A0A1M7ZKC9_9HYPH|nr:phosphate signaling complex protein PhoU [Pseudoxanthobacter soli]SHO65331.1 phosphate transport system protein [Pseudoxanthobacter soli DSM 19599]
MPSTHVVKAFDDELQTVISKIIQMGGRVEWLFSASVDALLSGATDRAASLIAEDADIDRLEAAIEDEAILVIARRQPVATDLRDLFSAVKIASELERIGDLGKTIAKRAVLLGDDRVVRSARAAISDMANFARNQLKTVLDAYVENDAAKATSVRNADAALDTHYTACFRQILTYMMEDPRNISSCVHLLHVAKSVERIGDHTTNIAEYVLYRVTGEIPRDDRPKGEAIESVLAAEAHRA